MRVLPVALSVAVAVAPMACTREAAPPTDGGPTVAASDARGGSGPGQTLMIIAIGALILVVLAVATADRDDFLDYSDICGTPDCS